MTPPLISIVTISYNQLPYLPRCVASVAAQGWPNFEHIVVDPGSTDGSREWLLAQKAAHMTLLMEPDAGPADGLNKGIAMARGEIVMYLNSDDELAPGAMQNIAALHAQNPEADILIGNGWWIDGVGTPLRYMRSDAFSRLRYALKVGAVMQQSTSFRESVFRSISFNPGNRVNWDAELLVDALGAGLRVQNHDSVVGYFRHYEGTITHSSSYDEMRRAEYRRLAHKCVPHLPIPVLQGLSAIARGAKFLLCRVIFRGKRPPFPGLAGLEASDKGLGDSHVGSTG